MDKMKLLQLLYVLLHKGGQGDRQLRADSKLRNTFALLIDDGMIQLVRVGNIETWVLTTGGREVAWESVAADPDAVNSMMADVMAAIGKERKK